MKYIALLLILLLASCGASIRGGSITGKYTTYQEGFLNKDTIRYYLQLTKNDQAGEVEVTKEAWEQAKSGMVWPFEVK